MKTIKLIIIVLAVLGFQSYLGAQTCSCAGAPVFNPLEYSTTREGKKWHFELTYKYHVINDLVDGSQQIGNDIHRHRTSRSVFFETRYSVSPKWTLIANMNFTRHARDVGISSSSGVSTNGLGDGMLSIQYTPVRFSVKSKTELSIGGGVKIPTGRSNVTAIGIASEDMQPGTGSWDGVAWAFVSRKLTFVRGLELFTGASYRFNGSNKRDYHFGNEIIAALGTKLRTRGLLDYSLYARYRWTDSDQRFKGDIPNTGGNWIYLVPSVILKASKDFGLKTQVELPLYRKLNGSLQFTTTILVSVSMYYEI